MRRLTPLLVLLLASTPAAAGLYSLDDPCPFEVQPDGTARPLPNDPFVTSHLNPRVYAGFPTTPEQPVSLDWVPGEGGSAVATYGGRLGQLVAARWPKANQLRKADLASHAAALILLKPRSEKSPQDADRLEQFLLADRRNPLAQGTLAHLYAVQGRWDEAGVQVPDEDAVADPPPGTTAAQFRWQRKVESTSYRRWLHLRGSDAKARRSPKDPDQTPDPLFLGTDGKPIRYWEGAGEAAKLPADAVAQVQQLLLWAPWDDQLLWTLAEVNWAKGDVRAAHRLYLMLVEGRTYQEPLMLPARVKLVNEAFEKLPPDEAPVSLPGSDPPAPQPPPLVFGLIDPLAFYLGVVGLALIAALMLWLQVRAAIRRRRRRVR